MEDNRQPQEFSLFASSLKSTLVGKLHDGILLFNGVPYATVSERWTQSIPCDILSSPFDATEYGPRCPQRYSPGLMVGHIPDPHPRENEFCCLNLNICVPHKRLQDLGTKSEDGSVELEKLPVMVWVHGGSFVSGSNSVARYHPEALAKFAQSIGKPIIIVQVNYRLGAFGFVASNDLRQEVNSDTAVVGNYGLLDQRNAFLWVKEHIADFGGDPENVTAIGVSAGASCIHHHVLSGDPMFDRAVLMSGTAGTLGPIPLDFYESQWMALAESRGACDMLPRERLEILRSLTPEDLLSAYNSTLGPFADGNFLPRTWNLGDSICASRCSSLLLGDVRVEGLILDGISRRLSQSEFRSILQAFFPRNEDMNEFCSSFGFQSKACDLGDLSYDTYKNALRLFFSVAIFHFPTLVAAETFTRKEPNEPERKAYLYHFEEKSSWPGPTLDVAYHGQCATYLHLNQEGTDHFSPETAAIGTGMADAWINFAYGNEPWTQFSTEDGPEPVYRRFGPNGRITTEKTESDLVRDQSYISWVREHWLQVQGLCRHLLYSL